MDTPELHLICVFSRRGPCYLKINTGNYYKYYLTYVIICENQTPARVCYVFYYAFNTSLYYSDIHVDVKQSILQSWCVRSNQFHYGCYENVLFLLWPFIRFWQTYMSKDTCALLLCLRTCTRCLVNVLAANKYRLDQHV